MRLFSQAEVIDQSAGAARVPMAIEEPQEGVLRTFLVGISRSNVMESQIRELGEERE